MKLVFFLPFLSCVLFQDASWVGALTSEEESGEQHGSSTNKGGSTGNHGQYGSGVKGDTTAPSSSRYTSARAYVDERKRDGYRYFGTGSKSGNSFLPTNIHKSTSSLDSHNYFVTTKSNIKDLETAGSGMSTGGTDGNNYLTVYDSPSMVSAGGGGSAASSQAILGMEEQFGDMAAETGMGGYGSGGGGGYGTGGKGCNSALGLLGVLGLAAYLQNVLRNMQNGTAGRRRRDVSLGYSSGLESKLKNVKSGMAQLDVSSQTVDLLALNETSQDMGLDDETYRKVMRDVFPLLSAVAHARDGLIPIHCTHSSVCETNRVLVQDLGHLGHSIGIRISRAISKLLSRVSDDEKSEQIRMISKAGKMGRNRRNCLTVFPICHRLKKLPTYNVPFILESHNSDGDHTYT